MSNHQKQSNEDGPAETLAVAAGSACHDCKYLGREYDYLRGAKGVEHWVQCNYPLPFFVTPQATPLGDRPCRVYEPNNKITNAPPSGE